MMTMTKAMLVMLKETVKKIRDIVRSSTVDKYSHYIHHYFNWQDTHKANCQYLGCIQVIFDIFHPAGMTFTDWVKFTTEAPF